MKKSYFHLMLIAVLAFPLTGQAQDEFYTSILSYNIRYDNPSDPNPWYLRKSSIIQQVSESGIVGLQEVLYSQIEDLTEELPRYKWFGVGRDDGQSAGEFCPIFYDAEKFQLMEHGTFWLSETPDKPGLGWDAACNRICTWGHFQRLGDGKTFYLFNTHFDHQGKKARANSAKLLREKIATLRGSEPALITGDFNAEEKSKTYKRLTKGPKDTRLADPVYAQENLPIGDLTTYCGFEALKCARKRIDYVFTAGEVKMRLYVSVWASLEGFLPSDHLPVITEVDF